MSREWRGRANFASPESCREASALGFLATRHSSLATVFAEYAAQGVEFTRGLGNMPWHKREFVVKDCDGRLLAFARTCTSICPRFYTLPLSIPSQMRSEP